LLLAHSNDDLSVSNEDSATTAPTVSHHDWMIAVSVEKDDISWTMTRHGYNERVSSLQYS
jgi:hypothetical protein